MILRFRDATPGDVPAIAALQNAASGALTARFGAGPWSTLVTERDDMPGSGSGGRASAF